MTKSTLILGALGSNSAGAPVEDHKNNQTKTWQKQTNKLRKMVCSDPDVVLPLKADVNLSFNWEGQDHQVRCFQLFLPSKYIT